MNNGGNTPNNNSNNNDNIQQLQQMQQLQEQQRVSKKGKRSEKNGERAVHCDLCGWNFDNENFLQLHKVLMHSPHRMRLGAAAAAAGARAEGVEAAHAPLRAAGRTGGAGRGRWVQLPGEGAAAGDGGAGPVRREGGAQKDAAVGE